MRRLVPGLVFGLVVVGLVTGAGCTRAGEASGGGDKVGFCDVYRSYDELREPAPSDPSEVSHYAQGVARLMRRVDPDIKVDDRDLPAAIQTNVRIIEKAMERFDQRYRAAPTKAGRLAAEAALSTDEDFARANRALTTFAADRCRRRVSNPVFVPPTTTAR